MQILSLTGTTHIQYRTANPLGLAEVIIDSQCNHSFSGESRQTGNAGTWQVGVRAFLPHCGIKYVSTCFDKC